MLTYAHELFKWFVQKSKNFRAYNVHNLVHLCDNFMNHNDYLNAIAALEFENKLQSKNKLVQSSFNLLFQIIKWISELEDAKNHFQKNICI